ncbi:hypothetical protein BKA65DRAFT_70753 [Rhexocercosporidium sp. MPI-PUGE-AT-0058]|nr:hypothetical protein BKA65DRAFT_70753 [Rhexocercosporidium sp. MPI-PUGE-AT-0058]
MGLQLHPAKSLDIRQWHVTSTDTFQRPMSPFESFFDPALGWSVWASINVGAIPNSSNTSEDFINRVRLAWIRALYEQPQLASVYDFTSTTCSYTRTTDQNLSSWLEETFTVLEFESQNPRTAVVCRKKPILCINPITRQLLFRGPHYYIDGIGINTLLADIVSYIAAPVATIFKDEFLNLGPIFELAADVQAPNAKDIWMAANLTGKFLTSQPSVGIPCSDGNLPDVLQQHGASGLRLSAIQSQALVTACRARALTVTHAVQTAMIQATAELNPESNVAQYYSGLHIANWRARVKLDYQRHRCALYCGAFPIVIADPSSKDFSELSKEVKEEYVGTSNDRSLEKVHALWWAELVAVTTAAGPPPPSTASTPVMSSLGIVEKHLPKVVQGIEIKDFCFGNDVNGPLVILYVWNWEGRVSIHSSWDRRYYQEREAASFLKKVWEILAGALGLEVSI